MNVVQLTLEPDENIAFLGDPHCDNQTPVSRIDNYLETCCHKLADIRSKCVSKKVRALFLEGDVFSRILVTHEAVNLVGAEFSKMREAGIRVFTIVGNHDMVRNSQDNFQRSPLQTLFTFGAVEHIHRENMVIINKKVLITPVDYTEEVTPAIASAKVNILLAHMFYETSSLISSDEHNLKKKLVEKLGYDAIFLGHDHEEYPITQVGKTIIVRSGSMTRGTSHNYNFTRKPKFVVVHNVEELSRDSIEYVEIDHKNFEDIASSAALNKKADNSSLSDLNSVLSNLAEKLSESSTTDGDRILEIIKNDDKLDPTVRQIILSYVETS